ncbi:MAG: hypothetical protein R2681_03830 [Pyrinomonadaceae bacterium]
MNNLQQKLPVLSAFAAAVFFISFGAFAGTVFGQTNYLITTNSVGDTKIGMTIGEARKVFKGAEFNQFDYGEEGIWIEVTDKDKLLIRFSTDQKNAESDDDGRVAIDDSAKIERIEISNDSAPYKTAEGIGVGSTVADAEKAFGRVTKIELWEYDASEHAWFENGPPAYSFTINPAENADEDVSAGDYPADEYSTTKYTAGAYISSITVSKEDLD